MLVYPAGPVQLNVYNGDVVFGVPPVTVRSIVPLLSWWQSKFVPSMKGVNNNGSKISKESLLTHPLSSVIFNIYKPEPKL